jgi:hypothetical protein
VPLLVSSPVILSRLKSRAVCADNKDRGPSKLLLGPLLSRAGMARSLLPFSSSPALNCLRSGILIGSAGLKFRELRSDNFIDGRSPNQLQSCRWALHPSLMRVLERSENLWGVLSVRPGLYSLRPLLPPVEGGSIRVRDGGSCPAGRAGSLSFSSFGAGFTFIFPALYSCTQNQKIGRCGDKRWAILGMRHALSTL